ncbi:MAG TPA: hypothetical protein VFI42_12935 [Thermomicrobiaceae bacterium]|nr:hypothetical protein [Thermomicrobiaceae bacterium]
MAKRAAAPRAAAAEGFTETTGEVPIGGNAPMVRSKNLEAEVIEWGKDDTPATAPSVPKASEDPDSARAAKARKALMGDEDDESADDEETETPAAEAKGDGQLPDKVSDKPADAAPAAKPKRKDLFARIDEEKRRLDIENELKTERQKREELERTVKQGSTLQILQARGMTREQALEELLTNPEEAAAAAEPTKKEKDPEVEKLRSDVERLQAERREANMQAALRIVENTAKDLDVPLVRAAKKIPVPTDNGGVRIVSGYQLVLETARALWEQAGQTGEHAAHLKEAAELVEEQLQEENQELLDAYAKKRGGGAKDGEKDETDAKPAKKPAPPAVGKRMSAGSPREASGAKLPMDPEERKAAVKARLGLR